MENLRINLLKEYHLIHGFPSYKLNFKFNSSTDKRKVGTLTKENSIEYLPKLIKDYEPNTKVTLTSKTPKINYEKEKFERLTNNELKEMKSELENKLVNYTIDFLPGGP